MYYCNSMQSSFVNPGPDGDKSGAMDCRRGLLVLFIIICDHMTAKPFE